MVLSTLASNWPTRIGDIHAIKLAASHINMQSEKGADRQSSPSSERLRVAEMTTDNPGMCSEKLKNLRCATRNLRSIYALRRATQLMTFLKGAYFGENNVDYGGLRSDCIGM